MKRNPTAAVVPVAAMEAVKVECAIATVESLAELLVLLSPAALMVLAEEAMAQAILAVATLPAPVEKVVMVLAVKPAITTRAAMVPTSIATLALTMV